MHLKEKSFHILSFTLLIGVLASSAQAERKFYYYNASTVEIMSTASRWTDPVTKTALSAIDKTADYWLKGGKTGRTNQATRNTDYQWGELNVGSPSLAPEGWNTETMGTWWGGTAGYLRDQANGSSFLFGPLNLIWWNGKVFTNSYSDYYRIQGTFTIRQADDGVSHESYMNTQCQYVQFGATVKSSDEDENAADAVWTFSKGAGSTLERMTGGANSQFRMNGNFSGYKGSFNVTAAYQPFIIYNGTIIGDPNTANPAALKLGTNAALAFAAEFEQGTTRGIQLTGDCAYLMTWETLANAYTVSYPVSKADAATGELIKQGPGTVTLAGAYSAGTITVAAGTLVLAESATFPAGQMITVKTGAKLVVIGKPLRSFAITAEDGAVVEHVVTPIAVEYDPTDKTVTTAVRADLALEDGERQPLVLSNKIALPSHDPLELEVLRITAGSRDYTEVDFEDATEKTYGLPRTGFSVVKSEDGIQHVYLSVRPVVTSVADIGNVGINGKASSWSDTAMPHSGADYLLKHDVGDVQKFGFKGDSLTIQTGVTLQFRASDASGNNQSLSLTNGFPVIVYPGVSTTQNYDGREFPCGGLIYLVGDYGDADVFDFYLKYGATATYNGQLRLDATLLGAGTLQIRGAKNGTSWNGLNGNNTNYFGRIIVSGNGTTAETKGTQCRVSKAEAFGGRLDEFQANAVTVYDYAMIKATGNVALTNDMNRGFRIANAGFNCDAGKTFETSWPIVLNGTLYKHGTGTLVLAGPMTHDTSSTKKFVVRAGTVSALSDEAVAGLTLTATNDFTVLVSPRSTAVNGFESVALTGDADPKINVVFDGASAEKGASYKLPICTVESDSGLTEGSFVVQKAKGYVCTLVSETVDETKTRWSLNCSKSGLFIVVR